MKNTTVKVIKRPAQELELRHLMNGSGFIVHGTPYLLPADFSAKANDHQIRVIEFTRDHSAKVVLMNSDALVRPCDLDLVFSE